MMETGSHKRFGSEFHDNGPANCA